MGRLDGKVAVITGATSGIGLHTAEIFVAEGAKIVIAGRRAPEGEALAKKLGAACIFRQTDVTVEAQMKALIALSVEKFGKIDCLFNNAGGPAQTGGIEGLEVDRFDAAMATLVRSVMLGMKHAAPHMRKQGSGSIINNGSIAGRLAGFSSSMVYGAAKAAVIHLTKCAAMELGESNIRVNSISPGAIATGIFGKALGLSVEAAEKTPAVMREVYKTAQPIPRAGLPRISRMPRCSLPATNPPSSTATISWSMAPSPAAATGPSSSRAMSRCARRSIRVADCHRHCEGEAKQSILCRTMDASRAVLRTSGMTSQTRRDNVRNIRLSRTGRPFHLAVIAGLACAFVIGKALPSTMDAISAVIEPLCASSDPAGSTLDVVEPIGSLCAAERAGQARHDRARVLRSGRIYPRAPACRLRHRLHHQGRNPLAARRRSRSRPSRSASRSSSRPARCIWSRPMPATPSPRN